MAEQPLKPPRSSVEMPAHPAPRTVTDEEINFVKTCLQRWRNEIEQDIQGWLFLLVRGLLFAFSVCVNTWKLGIWRHILSWPWILLNWGIWPLWYFLFPVRVHFVMCNYNECQTLCVSNITMKSSSLDSFLKFSGNSWVSWTHNATHLREFSASAGFLFP